MSFWQQYADSIAVILSVVLAVFAITRSNRKEKEDRQLAMKNSENMLKGYVRSHVSSMAKDILDKFSKSRTEAKQEKKDEIHDQKDRCEKQCKRIENMEKDFIDIKDERRLNLECHDIVLEVLQPQGNGRIRDMRGKLKTHLYEKSTD